VKQVTQYIREKHQLLSQHNVFERAKHLSKPGTRHQYAERLDADILRASLIAERRIHKYKDPPWSIELDNARKKVSVLSKALTMAKTGVDHTEIIHKATVNMGEGFQVPTTAAECSTAVKEAKKQVKEIIARSFSTRESERDKQIAELEAEAESTKTSKEKQKKLTILRILKKAEAIKKLFQKLQILRNTRQRGGITRLEVPTNPHDDPRKCNHWKVIDVPTEILNSLQQRNRQTFWSSKRHPVYDTSIKRRPGFHKYDS
jgi:hypothetical protein